MGFPVLRALSLCTCCRHYPGVATGGTALLIRPVVPAFPGLAAGSARASTFSRLARRSLALRPAHSRCHRIVARLPEGFNHFVSSIVAPVLPAGAVRRVGLSPTGKRRLITAHAKCRSNIGTPTSTIQPWPTPSSTVSCTAVIASCSRVNHCARRPLTKDRKSREREHLHNRVTHRAAPPSRKLPNDLQPPSEPLPAFLAAPPWCSHPQEPKIDNEDDRPR
jgi:hypothetical protein